MSENKSDFDPVEPAESLLEDGKEQTSTNEPSDVTENVTDSVKVNADGVDASESENQSEEKRTRRSTLKDPELAQKSLVLAAKTPIWIDVVASAGVIGVLISNASEWSIWARVFFLLLMILGLIGQSRFSASVAIRSDWFVGIGIAGAVLGFAIGIILIPWVLWYSLSAWWVLGVFVVFTIIATLVFRGLRWGTLVLVERRELNKKSLAEDKENYTEADEADAEKVDEFTEDKVSEIEAEERKSAELAEQLENLEPSEDLSGGVPINPLRPLDEQQVEAEDSAETTVTETEGEDPQAKASEKGNE